MSFYNNCASGLNKRRLELTLALAAILITIAMISGALASAAAPQDSRPRRSNAIAPPAATPTPTPAAPRTVQTTNPPATNANTRPVSSTTPTPKASQTPYDRIAPQLGEPPPAPVLKPKPTPTPSDEDFDEGSILKINTELVTLNVRVIDRNNRPIDNVRENEFHVYEDGVLQPIESFSREEVPISYGLAVDTSGSLRSQLQAVIDAGKTIINSNKTGDETFLVRFISSDQIETVQDKAHQKCFITGLIAVDDRL